MDGVIHPTREEACDLAARIMAKEIRAKPNIVLGLATGRTMERVYGMLAERHRDEGLDFAEVVTFNLDEYIGLPPDHPNSYRQYMEKHLFQQVNVAVDRTFLPNGVADDIDAECERYEELILESGGIDFQLLGIGRSGHIGFNEPLSALLSRTRPKALMPATVEQNAPLFDNPDEMPRRAITMGVGTILEARRCVLLATGEEKAEIIAKAVEGPVTSMISATALQLHPKCTVIVDEAASRDLQHRDYYQWTFENEPEWEEFQ